MAVKNKNKVISNFMLPTEISLTQTGILPFDIVMGGGFQRGDLIEIASKSGLGKSTLCLDICRRMLAQGWRCAYIDVESGVKSKILENMDMKSYYGTDLKSQLIILTPQTYQDLANIFEIIVTGEEEDRFDLVIVDSFSACSLVQKKDEPVSVDQAIGVKARQEKGFLELFKNKLRTSGTTVLLINQMRIKFKQQFRSFKAYEDSSGGNACQHYCDVRLWLDEGKKLVREENTVMGVNDKTIYGCAPNLSARKNRIDRPEIKVIMPVVYGYGVSNYLFVEKLLEIHGMYKTTGAKTEFNIPGLTEINETPLTKGGVDARRRLIKENFTSITEALREAGFLSIIVGKDQNPILTDNDVDADEEEEYELDYSE